MGGNTVPLSSCTGLAPATDRRAITQEGSPGQDPAAHQLPKLCQGWGAMGEQRREHRGTEQSSPSPARGPSRRQRATTGTRQGFIFPRHVLDRR